MARIAFILHGKIFRWKKLWEEIQDSFNPEHESKLYLTDHHGHSRELAKQAIKDGYKLLISVGGDGSINETVNGIMDSKEWLSADDWAKIRMGVLPRGSGNDFVKTAGISGKIEDLRQLIEQDEFKEIDLGQIHFINHSKKKESRYFLNITDVGLGGYVIEKVHNYSPFLGKGINYQRAIISALLKYRNQHVKISSESISHEGPIKNLVIANGKYFGKGLGIAPHAELNNGFFALVLIKNISVWDYIKHLPQIRKCEKINHPELSYHQTKNLSIESIDKPMAIEMDGEFVGFTPFEVEIIPKVLKIFS